MGIPNVGVGVCVGVGPVESSFLTLTFQDCVLSSSLICGDNVQQLY